MLARSLFFENKKLRVFDLDDTLVKTDSFVYVTRKNGSKLKLSPAQFAVYKRLLDDTFDFSDFGEMRNPVLIKAYVELLKRMAREGMVYILTARDAYKPAYDFIRQLGIKNVYVVALADGNPEKKADWIEQKITDEKYDEVFFIDDSPKNVEAVRKRLRKYDIIKKIQLAKSDVVQTKTVRRTDK